MGKNVTKISDDNMQTGRARVYMYFCAYAHVYAYVHVCTRLCVCLCMCMCMLLCVFVHFINLHDVLS